VHVSPRAHEHPAVSLACLDPRNVPAPSVSRHNSPPSAPRARFRRTSACSPTGGRSGVVALRSCGRVSPRAYCRPLCGKASPGEVAIMNEREIQQRLVPVLRGENPGDGTLIACQRDICWRQGRVDVVVVNGALSGFEIKSRRDSLARLPRQADLYSRVLDYATVVCPAHHLDDADAIIPAWWGLRKVASRDEEVTIEVVREPLANPWVLPHDLVRLLYHDELYAELVRVRGMRRISRMRQAEMAWLLVELTEVDELRRIVRERLRQRPSWRAAALRT
jgi:hypothetical protein